MVSAFFRSGTGKIHCDYFKDVAAKRLGFSAGGKDCIGSTKLALISSYGTKWPLHIHANMSSLRVGLSTLWCFGFDTTLWMLTLCYLRWPQWWILSSLVTRPSLKNRALATMEVGIENHTVKPHPERCCFSLRHLQSGYFGDIEIVNGEFTLLWISINALTNGDDR